MKHYGRYGFNEFYIALGYKGEAIKRFFIDHHTLSGDITVNLATGEAQVTSPAVEDWTVHLVDTGEATLTGGRVKRLQKMLGNAAFMLTYGDGVCNIPLDDLVAFHRRQNRLATVTAVRPPARFGGIDFDGDRVAGFIEKAADPRGVDQWWIHGARARGVPLHQRRRGGARGRCARTPRGGRPAVGLSPRRLLAVHGHPAGTSAMLEDLWRKGSPPWKTW